MTRFRTLALIGGLLVLTACASDNSKARFLQAEAGYVAVLQLAANYVALPRCEAPAAPKICSKQAVVDQIRPAANSADATIQAAEDLALSDSPPDGALEMATQAAGAAVKSLQAIMAQYNIGGI